MDPGSISSIDCWCWVFFFWMLCNWTATCHTIICSPWSENGEHLFSEHIREKYTLRHRWQLDLALHFQKVLLNKVFYKTEKKIYLWDAFFFIQDKIKYAQGSNISLSLLNIKIGMRIFKHLYFIAPMHFGFVFVYSVFQLLSQRFWITCIWDHILLSLAEFFCIFLKFPWNLIFHYYLSHSFISSCTN